MIYRVDGIDYVVEIVKKSNKNTYFRIKDDLTICVTTGRFASKMFIKKVLDDNIDKIEKAIEKKKQELEKKEKFYYLGKKYDVIYAPSFSEVEISGDKIYVSDQKTLEKWLNKKMKELFLERLNYNYNLFEEKIPYPSLKIRLMKTRWGVCNRKNLTVTINSSLIKESIDKLDYVIIHELSHLVHFNHSKAFWSVVGKYCTDYKRIRKDLRE